MNPNVVSEEYIALQTALINKQSDVKAAIDDKMVMDVTKQTLDREIPVLPQLDFSPVPGALFRETIKDMAEVLTMYQPSLDEDVNMIAAGLTDETILKWIKESVTFNDRYFQRWAADHGVSDWLPHFLAEQSLRPFMQLLADKVAAIIQEFDVMGTCPCCGEPHRVAILDEFGWKYLRCPRCETEWKQKRVACVHCGDDRTEHLFYINIKEDETAKLEVCETCSNYLKVVNPAEELKMQQASLLDLQTIHLDFVAQEEGYGGESPH
ncbi:formate dehydrogenase accessory protein FdhE [Salisediminibacterium halotolerans]|uniref:FdhE protein n=1 Tax=Salisediminibacterium halotolerans TaxID=517425 RepID=A0A1H9UWF0_9BACI|nr:MULTISPECIES: formate dehydrogenase accessory protein FdhE [Salisediminibacterium]RLJ80880.1 FdhE protein [Actinophytocola xinjiangensis]RPE83934.1 FdhE protein [Salisediminibacterium halotolerans]TWG37824.1 FdhE protein [Salisediminibacterium halotolerans]SES13732.1 FdhE protein [Salisediminibacterium haloalkalitolerans]GEL09049.1 hypothetical protein SHA02_24650 [Salisediminibacterium halotolerans]